MSDVLDLEQRPSRPLWLFAGAAALALHLGGAALAVAHLKDVDDDDSLGAPAIEIGLELASTNSEPTDLPPGPDSDASVASPALAEQKAEVKETDLPKDTPAEEAEADRVVTLNDVKKPVEEEAKVAKVETQASQESVAAEATAAPSLDNAPKAERSVAPAIGTGMAARRVRTTWQKELIAHLDRHKRLREIRAIRGREGWSLGAIISELLSEALAGLLGRVCFAISSAADDKERKERPMAQHERLPKTKFSAIRHAAEPSPRRGVLPRHLTCR
jgi:periplasmic protein TonB